jgi:hypothetical protein
LIQEIDGLKDDFVESRVATAAFDPEGRFIQHFNPFLHLQRCVLLFMLPANRYRAFGRAVLRNVAAWIKPMASGNGRQPS